MTWLPFHRLIVSSLYPALEIQFNFFGHIFVRLEYTFCFVYAFPLDGKQTSCKLFPALEI